MGMLEIATGKTSSVERRIGGEAHEHEVVR
jgi:hypothetical protein